MDFPLPIRGSKTSSLSGFIKGGGQGVEADNTLRSAAFARIVELIGEGQIAGLVNGGTSIYFNQTPVVNANGTVNFRGVQWESRVGLPDQPALPGNSTAENVIAVGIQVQENISPSAVTIVDPDVTSAQVIVRVPALTSTDSSGNINPTSVSWVVEIQPNGGYWTLAATVNLNNQKCTSAYQHQSVFDIPPGSTPCNLRVRRITKDSDNVRLQNETWWDSYTTIVAGNFIYPNSAVVGLTVDSELFSASAIPARSFHIQGLIIQVPSNYNPTTRVYTGVWDGTFQMAYSNNPAWVLYDLFTNDRYGIGEFIDATKVDKWSLYSIAQYCDQLVSDGYGGQEPRYTFNGVLNNRQEAYKALQNITSSFRGMAYWSIGQVFAIADMPMDPVKLVSPTNVIDGHFNYSGTALKARHSVAMIRWNNPIMFYGPDVEVVVSEPQLIQYGWRETNLTAIGCTSRGQANRMGKWLLDTEQFATETVEYTASWDHIDVRPGDVIAIADPNKAQVRLGGRIQVITSQSVLTLDQPFVPVLGQTYALMVEFPDGTIGSQTIASFSTDNQTVTLESALAQAPLIGAMWVITSTELAPRQYRVISIAETEKNLFKITALFYDPTKYDRVEGNLNLATIQYSRPQSTINPPANFQVQESVYFQNGVAANRLTFSWSPSDDFLAQSYLVTGISPNIGGTTTIGQTNVSSLDADGIQLGQWTFNIQSVGFDGRVSTDVSIDYNVQGWAATPPPYVSMLEVFDSGNSANFSGKDCHVTWENNFPGSTSDVGQSTAGVGSVNPFFLCNSVSILDATTGTVLRTETVYTSDYVYTFDKNTADNVAFNRGPQRAFSVSVVVQDTLGRQSPAVTLAVDNPVPDVIFPTVTSGAQAMYVTYVNPSDADFVGSFVWASTDQNFDPLATTPVYQGSNNLVAIPGDLGTTYYIRIAGYDQFGTDNLNISPPFAVTVGGYTPNVTPPDIPTSLELSTSNLTLTTGEVQQVLTATWDASPSSNFAYFDVEIQDGAGSFISYQTSLDIFSWPNLVSGHTYTVKVRAWSQTAYASAFCASISIAMPAKTTGPGAITELAVAASLKSVYLQWVNPSDADLDHLEIWFGTTGVLGAAVLAGTSYGTAFTQAGLTTGVELYYWVRAVNTSGVAGAYAGPVSVTPGAVANGDIVAGSITADRLVAGSITGDLLNITTSLPPTITIGTTGVEIGDPAALINYNNTTQIAAGLIEIDGSTTLASWQNGSDATKIDGGSIAANTIAANLLTIGLRGVTITGFTFAFNIGTSVFSWTAGTIQYLDDAGDNVTVTVAAGSLTYTGTPIYVWWEKDATTLSNDIAASSSADVINFASYTPLAGMIVSYGQTVVDGSNIVTGSIKAAQIAAASITADQIAAGTITATQIQAGAITADRLTAGTITATQIAANSITAALIAAGSITATQIAAGTITATQIAANSITAAQLDVTTLSAISADIGAVTAGTIQSTDGKMIIDLDGGAIYFNA